MLKAYRISADTARAYNELEATNTRTDLENIIEDIYRSVYFNAISGNLATGLTYTLPLPTALTVENLKAYKDSIVKEFTDLGYFITVNTSVKLEGFTTNYYVYAFKVEVYWE